MLAHLLNNASIVHTAGARFKALCQAEISCLHLYDKIKPYFLRCPKSSSQVQFLPCSGFAMISPTSQMAAPTSCLGSPGRYLALLHSQAKHPLQYRWNALILLYIATGSAPCLRHFQFQAIFVDCQLPSVCFFMRGDEDIVFRRLTEACLKRQ